MAAAPTGTVTFLFTDVESSTQLWERAPDAMRSALARHDDIVRRAIDAHGGYVFSTGGDGFAAAFQRTTSAVEAAATAQRELGAQAWPGNIGLRIRMGIHTGECANGGRHHLLHLRDKVRLDDGGD
jgi:class 3 adenylate cyclase